MKNIYSINILVPISFFLLAFCIPLFVHLDNLSMMPGDIGDARLNNYLLENVYQFFIGKSDSLWHLSFFFPFPYIIGFSDNHFGSSPVYLLVRLFGRDADTTYQIWFLFGYAVNFISAYYALRRLKGSMLAATVGALIFTFALPTTAHANHAQLHYRFGLPVAIAFLMDFLNSKKCVYLLMAFAWLVWQFYSGIYIGFFTLLLMLTIGLSYFGWNIIENKRLFRNFFNDFSFCWKKESKKQKTMLLGGFTFLLLLIFVLFYPYWQVTHLYEAKRSWAEISLMLPRLQSYFLADASFFWSNSDARIFADLPVRHEHQMFIGLIPLVLALTGFFLGSHKKNGVTFTVMTGGLAVAVFLTIYIGGFSLWYFLHKFPLASAIRAVARIDQVFLFPIAYLAVVGIDDLRWRVKWSTKAIPFLIFLFFVEAGMTSMPTSTKDSWRQRILLLDGTVPKNLPGNSILFFAQQSSSPFADELDAMWVSLKHRAVTMNGYSGLYPPGYEYAYGSDCSIIPRRVLSYLSFSRLEDINSYRGLMSRIVPVGFNNCDPMWMEEPPI